MLLIHHYLNYSNLNKLISSNFDEHSLLIFPTESFYAIGCPINNKKAVNRINKLKSRGKKVFPMIVDGFDMILDYIDKIREDDFKILKSLNDAPLTIAFQTSNPIKEYLNPNGRTLAFRVIKSNIALHLTKIFNHPIIATSANISGENPTNDFNSINPFFLKQQNIIIIKENSKKKKYQSPSTVVEYIPYKKIDVHRWGSYHYKQLKESLPNDWEITTKSI